MEDRMLKVSVYHKDAVKLYAAFEKRTMKELVEELIEQYIIPKVKHYDQSISTGARHHA